MKKLTALMLAVVMVLCLFAGCGGNTTQTGSTGTAAGTGTESGNTGAGEAITSSEVEKNNVEEVEVNVTKYTEAPVLAAKVQAGELAPIEERIPDIDNIFIETNSSSGEALKIGKYSSVITVPTTGVGNWGICRYNDQTLSMYNTDNTRYMNVIKSYEYNEDYTVYTWHLREGMRWSDGTPFTADDITFWYYMCHLTNYNSNKSWNGFWTLADDGETKEYAVLTKVDDYTVTWTFAKSQYEDDFFTGDVKWAWCCSKFFIDNGLVPSSYYVENPYWADMGLSDEDVLTNAKKIGIDMENVKDLGKQLCYYYWNYYQIPSFAAWILTDQAGFNTKNDDLIILVRNPYFWKVDAEGQQLPYIDEMHIQKYADNDQAQLAYLSGDIDYYPTSNAAEIPGVMAQTDSALKMQYGTKWGDYQYSFNYCIADDNYYNLFNNIDFRQAMSIALDRDTCSELITDGFVPGANAAPNSKNFGYNPDWYYHWTEYNVEQAKALLEGCGLVMGADGFYDFADGSDLVITFLSSDTTSAATTTFEVVNTYWRAVGIKAILQQNETDQVKQIVDSNDFYAVFASSDNQGGIGLISRPKAYLPNYNASDWCAGWCYYYDDPETNAGTHFEPNDDVKKIVELGKSWFETPSKAERDAIELEIYRITIENGWIGAITESSPNYYVVKSSIQNWYDNINEDKYYYIGLCHPWTWFIEE